MYRTRCNLRYHERSLTCDCISRCRHSGTQSVELRGRRFKGFSRGRHEARRVITRFNLRDFCQKVQVPKAFERQHVPRVEVALPQAGSVDCQRLVPGSGATLRESPADCRAIRCEDGAAVVPPQAGSRQEEQTVQRSRSRCSLDLFVSVDQSKSLANRHRDAVQVASERVRVLIVAYRSMILMSVNTFAEFAPP